MLDKKIKAKIRHPASSASDQVVSEEAAAWAGAAPVQRLEAEAPFLSVRLGTEDGGWLRSPPVTSGLPGEKSGGRGSEGSRRPGAVLSRLSAPFQPSRRLPHRHTVREQNLFGELGLQLGGNVDVFSFHVTH